MGYQDPKVERHGMTWRIRPYVLELDGKGGQRRRRRSIILGPAEGLAAIRLGEAVARKLQIMATINNRRLMVSAQVTFAEVVEHFRLGRLPVLKASTRAKYTSFIDRHILPSFGKISLAEIDRPFVQMWLNGLASSLESSSLQSLKNCLSAIFTYAEDANLWTGRNPCERVAIPRRPKGKERKREERIPTPVELGRFMACLEDTVICTAADAKMIAALAVVTTMRIGEILGLRWGDLDAKTQQVAITRRIYRGDVDEPKSKAGSRVVFLAPVIVEELERRRGRADAYIFQREGKPLDDRDLQQHVFRPAAERAKIYYAGFGLHKLRHAAITWRQTHAGATALETMKLAGHTSLKMTAHYTAAEADRQREQSTVLYDLIKTPPSGSGSVQ